MHKITWCSVLALLLTVVCTDVEAQRFDFPASTTSINKAQFDRAMRRAGNNGIITFPARTIRVTGDFNVDRGGVTLRGRGGGATLRRTGSGVIRALLNVTAADVTVSNLTLQGADWPEFAAAAPGTAFTNDLADREGAAPVEGLDSAVRISSAGVRFELNNCRIRMASNGVRYNPNALPSGLRALNCQFTTNRAMFWMTDRGSAGETVNGPLPERFIIDNCDYVGERGRGVASAGIYWDYGNSSDGESINLRGSVIRNCEILRMSKWNIAFTRVSGLRIVNNVLNGGGDHGDTTFVHPLHFEDVTNPSNPIIVRRNTLRQDARVGGVLLRSRHHLWTGGNNGLPVVVVEDNNTYSGISNTLFRVDRPED